MRRWLAMAFIALMTIFVRGNTVGVYQSKSANPIINIYQSCLLPLMLGDTPIVMTGQKDIGNLDGSLYTCTNPLRTNIKVNL